MKVEEVMTLDPVCCLRSDTAKQAAVLMDELNVGVLPIVDEADRGHLIGIVTDRDLCMAVVAAGQDPTNVSVGDCMTAEPVCCKLSDDVDKVFAMMQYNQLRRIPVVSANDQIEGIVSVADLALLVNNPAAMAETIKDISEPPGRPL